MRGGLSHQEHSLKPEKFASGRFFSLQRLPYGGGALRFSCVVTKKVAQKAVDRNRIRRRVRAAFVSAAGPGLFVIHIKKPALTASFEILTRELSELVHKIAQ